MFHSIGIIGAGVMGKALVKCLIAGNLVKPNQITVSDPSDDRLQYLSNTFQVKTTLSNADAISEAEIVILAVKPQHAKAALLEAAPAVSQQLFLSIMAGVPISALNSLLKTKQIVRSMPNMPAQIGAGMTVWYAAPEVSAEKKTLIRAILQSFGSELEVADERLINAATAVSGSGPAYVFDFAAHLIAAACALGFDQPTAKLLILQTLKGSTQLLSESSEDAKMLRQQVTSKGGTTEAAFSVIDQAALETVFSQALYQAFLRAEELSQMFDKR